MKNCNYPEFNFAKWLIEYTKSTHCPREYTIEGDDTFKNSVLGMEIDELQYNQQCFLNQIHIDTEYDICPSCDFLKTMMKFNEFLCLLQKEKPTKESLLAHFRKLHVGIPEELSEKSLSVLLKTLNINL